MAENTNEEQLDNPYSPLVTTKTEYAEKELLIITYRILKKILSFGI